MRTEIQVNAGDIVHVNWGGSYGSNDLVEQMGMSIERQGYADHIHGLYGKYGNNICKNMPLVVVKGTTRLDSGHVLIGVVDPNTNREYIIGSSDNYVRVIQKVSSRFELPDELFEVTP